LWDGKSRKNSPELNGWLPGAMSEERYEQSGLQQGRQAIASRLRVEQGACKRIVFFKTSFASLL